MTSWAPNVLPGLDACSDANGAHQVYSSFDNVMATAVEFDAGHQTAVTQVQHTKVLIVLFASDQ